VYAKSIGLGPRFNPQSWFSSCRAPTVRENQILSAAESRRELLSTAKSRRDGKHFGSGPETERWPVSLAICKGLNRAEGVLPESFLFPRKCRKCFQNFQWRCRFRGNADKLSVLGHRLPSITSGADSSTARRGSSCSRLRRLRMILAGNQLTEEFPRLRLLIVAVNLVLSFAQPLAGRMAIRCSG
jgi:hypothetical protein